ncbi:MAG: type IV pilin [Thermoplasmata archaeon]|nr:type IV pilin [Thermoplasmata archaeon]
MTTNGGGSARWRKNGKRGVSPIIATILLVAITVVLAAVLYVLISGLTRGPGNTPIGSAIAVGQPTGPTTAACGGMSCNTYLFTFQTASTGVTANSMKFELQDGSGNNQNPKVNTVTLVDVSGCNMAVWTFTSSSWALASGGGACAAGPLLSLSAQISSGAQLSLITVGATPATSLSSAGYSLVIIGTGSYSGTVAVSIP